MPTAFASEHVRRQKIDTVTHSFDLAGRLLRRDHRTLAHSPSGTIDDAHVFTYDDAGRTLSAYSQAGSNTVKLGYDRAGRKVSESLTINFGTEPTFHVDGDYDVAGNCTRIWYPDNRRYNDDGTPTNNPETVTRSYTARDQLEEIDYNGSMVVRFFDG